METRSGDFLNLVPSSILCESNEPNVKKAQTANKYKSQARSHKEQKNKLKKTRTKAFNSSQSYNKMEERVAIAAAYDSPSLNPLQTRKALSPNIFATKPATTKVNANIPLYRAVGHASNLKQPAKTDLSSPLIWQVKQLNNNSAIEKNAKLLKDTMKESEPIKSQCKRKSKERKTKARNKSKRTQIQNEINLETDDEAFMLIASDVLELITEESDGENLRNNEPKDALIEQLLPNEYRMKFIDAVNQRMRILPTNPDKKEPESGTLTRKCYSLGLGSHDAGTNPLLLKLHQTHNEKETSNHEEKCIPQISSQPIHPSSSNGLTHNSHRQIDGKQEQAELASELVEATRLLSKSNTEQATSFWKEQVISLKDRIRKLELEQSKHNVPESELPDGRNIEKHSNTCKENGDFEKKQDIPFDYVMLKEDDSVTVGKNNLSPKHDNQKKYISDPSPQSILKSLSNLTNGKSEFTKAYQHQVKKDLPMVKVVAPSDLPGGYSFEAYVGNSKFLAMVPPGGIKKGQVFSTPMVTLDTIQISVMIGIWRDSLCDCITHGLCHPLLLCSFFFPQIGLGQIMTRSNLDWTGNVGSGIETRNTCVATTIIYILWIVLNSFSGYVVYEKWHKGNIPDISDIATLVIVNLLFLIYTIKAVATTRYNLRQKYHIDERGCVGCEDCCFATWCTCCTIAQMGRHTANFDTIRGVCCSRTGIPSHVVVDQGPFKC